VKAVKAAIVRVPGAFVLYKMLKNARFRMPIRPATEGGLRHGGLTEDASVAYVRDIFGKLDDAVCQEGGWEGRHVLEVGPGDSLGTGLLALAKGAASYCAIDRFAVEFDLAVERRVFLALMAGLTEEERRRVSSVIAILPDAYRVDESRFRYLNSVGLEDAGCLLARGSVDVIFSNAVLEHVADVGGSIASMRSLLRPGGIMLHDVDLRSHHVGFERHPMQILEYPDWLWHAMTSHTGDPNRARLPQYLEHLRNCGFVDVQVQVQQRFDAEMIERVRSRLARSFREVPVDDLEVAVFLLSARVPA
jgi:SAM-dependent methyltransferase